MSLLEQASLIVTPNAYKESKLYSVVPSDGAGDMTVVRATTATRVNENGIIESVANNIPRIDYTSGQGAILVEPQRTNLVLRSEEFDNASWLKSGSATTITENTTTAPNGTLTADKWSTAFAGSRYVYKTISISSGNVTASFFVKKDTSDWFFLNIVDGTNNAGYTFNVANGSLGQSISSGITPTASIIDFGNGWYRCSVMATVSGTSVQIRGYIASSSSSVSTAIGASLFVWGAQLEQGPYATSYIPTVDSTSTRNADVISKTGISSLIGQTEGTLFVDVNYKAESVSKNYLNLGTSTSNYIAIGARSNNKIGMEVLNSGVQVNAASTDTYSTSQRLKIAMTYKLNDFKLYVNGILQATDTSGTVPTKAEVYLGSYGNGTNQATDGINSAVLWKTALTDTELATLTTL